MQQPHGGGRPRSGGVLIRGATGHLWFMRSDGDPVQIKDDELEHRMREFVEGQPQGMMSFPMPEDIRQMLAKSLEDDSVDWGIVIIWAFELK
jgi:hypothetical protein